MEPTKATESLPPNPKQAYGDKKPNLALVPPALEYYAALALGDGAIKYGMYNWRKSKVEALTYVAAAKRHLDRWASRIERSEPEEWEKDGKLWHLGNHPELAHAIACLAILADAEQGKWLIDNRPPEGPDLGHLKPPYSDEIPAYGASPAVTALEKMKAEASSSERLGDTIARSAEKRETCCGACGSPGRLGHRIDCPHNPHRLNSKFEHAMPDIDQEYPPCICGPHDQAECKGAEQTKVGMAGTVRCVKARQIDEASRFDVV